MKSKITKLLVTGAIYLSPLMAFAQAIPTITSDKSVVSGKIGVYYSLSKLLIAGNNLVTIFVSIIITLSVLFIIWGGFSFITAGGDETKLTTARNRVLYGVIGIAIIILAGAIFAFVASILK